MGIELESQRWESVCKRVDDAIIILAPYFNIDADIKLKYPYVVLGSPCFCNNTIELENKSSDFDIGHEVSHWYHRWINEIAFLGASLEKMSLLYGDPILEFVADYGGIGYYNKKREGRFPIINGVELKDLVRMSRNQIIDVFPELHDRYLNCDLIRYQHALFTELKKMMVME